MWPESALLRLRAPNRGPDLPQIMPAHGSIRPENRAPPKPPYPVRCPSVDDARAVRGPFALWVGISIYALVMAAGNGLLNDPDTMWQITVGQWILDHRAVPETDIYSFTMQGQPWISTQGAQVDVPVTFAIAAGAGPVLAASAIALTFAPARAAGEPHLRESTTLVFVAAGLALTVPHLLARPHVLAMPVMILWIAA